MGPSAWLDTTTKARLLKRPDEHCLTSMRLRRLPTSCTSTSMVRLVSVYSHRVHEQLHPTWQNAKLQTAHSTYARAFSWQLGMTACLESRPFLPPPGYLVKYIPFPNLPQCLRDGLMDPEKPLSV